MARVTNEWVVVDVKNQKIKNNNKKKTQRTQKRVLALGPPARLRRTRGVAEALHGGSRSGGFRRAEPAGPPAGLPHAPSEGRHLSCLRSGCLGPCRGFGSGALVYADSTPPGAPVARRVRTGGLLVPETSRKGAWCPWPGSTRAFSQRSAGRGFGSLEGEFPILESSGLGAGPEAKPV